jgi:cell division protein FtsW
MLFLASYQLIKRENNLFEAYLKIGFLSLIFIQVIINLGVVIGLFPVTGITLPLISYGGSSLINVGFALGRMVHMGHENLIS